MWLQQCRLRTLSPGLMAYQKGGIKTARTIHDTEELVAVVPVDIIEIVGPRFRRMLDANFRLNREEYVKQLFTLTMPASDSRLQKKLSLSSIYNYDEHGFFQFTTIFCGKVVSCEYNPRTRTGWFNLD